MHMSKRMEISVARFLEDKRNVFKALLTRGSQKVADGSIAQWLERLTADQQVPGSNPGWPFYLNESALGQRLLLLCSYDNEWVKCGQ